VEYHSRGYMGRRLPLVSIQGTDFAEMRLMISPPLEFTGIFHLRGLTWQRSLRNATSSAFVDEFASILHLFVRAICGETTSTLTVFSRRFPKFESRKRYVLPMAFVTKNRSEDLLRFPSRLPESEAKFNAYSLFL